MISKKTLFRCFGNVSDSLYRRRIDRCLRADANDNGGTYARDYHSYHS